MVTSVYQYDPYGQVTLGSTEHTDFYGYNAESYNPNTGLEYLRARYYNTNKGRFFQEDTYLGDIADPLTLNRYAYTKNSPLNYVDPSGHKISSLGDFVSFVQNKATEFRDKASSYIYEKATGALKGMSEWAKESCETLDCELVTVAYNILLGAGFALVENALNIIFSMKELGSQWDSSDSDYYQKLMEDWVLENGVTDTTYFYLGQLVSDALQTYFAVKAIPKLLTKIGPALTKLAGILGGGSGGGMVPALVGVGEYASQIGMSAEIAETLVNEFGAAVAGVLIVFADITGIGHDAGKFVEALTKGDSETKFKTGDLYEDSIDVDGHRIDALAEVEVEGDRLILKDLAIYSNEGDIPNQIGASEFKTWLNTVKEQAKNQGFKELQIIAQRAEHSTSANPGHVINKIIQLK